jgi:hypothetical protein
VGLLDLIRTSVADGLIGADLFRPATLIKVTPGTRTPGSISGGTNPTTVSYSVQGVPGTTTTLRLNGTLIAGVDRVIKLFGARLPPGVVPAPEDRITMEGVTSTIVGNDGGNSAVMVDAARAVYVCQCRT